MIGLPDDKIVMPYQAYEPEPDIDAELMLLGNGNSRKIGRLAGSLESFYDGRSEIIETTDILRNHWRANSQENLGHYSVRLFAGPAGQFYYAGEIGLPDGLYSDAPYLMILQRKDEFVGVLGFEPAENSVLIQQIQGQCKDNSIRWPRALISIAARWAFHHEIPEAYVLPYERNRWEPVRNQVSHGGEPVNTRLIYDVSAKREKFKWDEKKQVFVRYNS